MKAAKRSPAATPTVPSSPDLVAPLPPQRRLFWILAAIVCLWIVALLLMYFLTVRPARNHAPADSALLSLDQVR